MEISRQKGTPVAKKTVVTKEEFSADEDSTLEVGEVDEVESTPLFDDIDRTSKAIEKVFVRRLDPASGYLGTLTPDITASISARRLSSAPVCS